MSDLARLTIWDDPAIRSALSWYLDVAQNRRPAKFRIAATVATQLDFTASSEGALWAELDRLTPIFVTRWQAIRAGVPLPQAADGPSLLELCRELAYRMLAHCNFCPWNCRVDRVAGAKFGACKLASGSRVSSHFHHTGEELFYRGTQGSGTIFFTSCNMRCAFCQNGDISTDKDNGEETDTATVRTPEELPPAGIMELKSLCSCWAHSNPPSPQSLAGDAGPSPSPRLRRSSSTSFAFSSAIIASIRSMTSGRRACFSFASSARNCALTASPAAAVCALSRLPSPRSVGIRSI